MMTVYAIPGLAATKELFADLKLQNAKLVCLYWPKLNKGDTMKSYARKFTKQIDTSKPFILLGVSFGGMLCSELSQILNPVKTILISSCKCFNELPPTIKALKKVPVQDVLSEETLREFATHSRLIIGFDKSFMPEFERMVESMQTDYFKNSINCIVNWTNKVCCKNNIVHIHGDADRLLLYRHVKSDYTIRGGNHAMVINNAEEISYILNKLI